MPNRDGLEPGQIVDFETMQRVERERRAKKAGPVKTRRSQPEKE